MGREFSYNFLSGVSILLVVLYIFTAPSSNRVAYLNFFPLVNRIA